MTAIVALRYFAASGVFAVATGVRRPGYHAKLGPQIRREIGWSLVSAVIYGVPAGVVAWGWQERGWTRIYAEWDALPLWYLPLGMVALWLLGQVAVLLPARRAANIPPALATRSV